MSTENDSLRQRTTSKADSAQQSAGKSRPTKDEVAPPDLDPDIRVVISLFVGLITIILTYVYYRVDLRDHGPFSTFINDKILGGNPWAQKVLLGGAGGEAWRNEL